MSPLDLFDLIIGPRPGRLSSGPGGGPDGTCSGRVEGVVDCEKDPFFGLFMPKTASSLVVSASETGVPDLSLTEPRNEPVSVLGVAAVLSPLSLKDPFIELVSDLWSSEFFLGDILSTLRGGGATPSLLIPGLISGAGTRSVSAMPCGRDGSIGGLFLSGGFPSCDGGSAAGSPNREAAGPIMPLRDLGGRPDVSALPALAKELATESWLLLLPARRRRACWF
jgi:hypothetical protein